MTTLTTYLSGQRMIERFTLRGHVVGLTLGEPVVGVMLFWWGVGLLPGGPVPSAMIYDVLKSVIDVKLAGAILAGTGALQVAGSTLAWFGIVPPVRVLRMTALLVSAFWWIFLASSLILSGTATVSPVVYLGIATLTLEQYRKAYLAGHRIL